jgi:hypothetical protein
MTFLEHRYDLSRRIGARTVEPGWPQPNIASLVMLVILVRRFDGPVDGLIKRRETQPDPAESSDDPSQVYPLRLRSSGQCF